MIRSPPDTPALLLAFLGIGYALGILNAGYYVVRLRQEADIRDFGSGNAGATNAGRLLGRWGFLAVLLLDAGKGAAAAGMACWASEDPRAPVVALAGAVLGHIWPIQLGFRGGKGVSTLLGGLLVVDPLGVAALPALFLPCRAILGRFVPSGLLALGGVPLLSFVRHESLPQAMGLMALVGIVWFAHRHDLRAEAFDTLRNAEANPPNQSPPR